MVVQTAPFVSPTRWQLAHTTWFFETFVLLPNVSDYSTPDPRYNYLFNSYYNAIGPQFPQAQRGTQSRPTVTQIIAWRAQVTDALAVQWSSISSNEELLDLIELGINHEQRHQELILMDIKHVLSHSPLDPAYNGALRRLGEAVDGPRGWIDLEPGVVEIGHDGSSGFAFDNEGPRHRVYLHGAQVADWLVTNADMLAFMDAGGYARPELWLSEGWALARQQGWRAPLYWREAEGGGWQVYTLSGWRALRADEPVCHVSYFEADALARFMGARLPTEAEWERAAVGVGARPCEAAFLDDGFLRPTPRAGAQDQLMGHVWEWTQSPYVAYPGFVAAAGAVGEYNGKFMSSQMVLRGGSALTPREHLRVTYRNFFGPGARWPMTGLPVRADYTSALALPAGVTGRRVVFFPGSTLGNFTREEAAAFLARVRALVGEGGGLILGLDLKKDPAVLHATYNDAQGVTAAFNKNLLARINIELSADFDVQRFYHYAPYNPVAGRIEMYLISACEQVVTVAGERFVFAEAEPILTEYLHKYTMRELDVMARVAGLRRVETWVDDGGLFSLSWLVGI